LSGTETAIVQRQDDLKNYLFTYYQYVLVL